MIRFEWDEEKNRVNNKKHGIWFEEARSAFLDPHHILFLDQIHSDHEERFVLIGYNSNNKLLVVVHVYQEATERIRIISSRGATKQERRYYEERI